MSVQFRSVYVNLFQVMSGYFKLSQVRTGKLSIIGVISFSSG